MSSNKEILMDDGIPDRSSSALNFATHRQIIITWEAARELHPQFDQLILWTFLGDNPSLQSMFSNFAHVPHKDLMNNKPFQDLAEIMLLQLDAILNLLGNQDMVFRELEKIGENHYNRGTTVRMFENYLRTVASLVKELHGDHFNEEADMAWETGIQFLLENVNKLFAIHGARAPLFRLDDFVF